MAGQFGKVRIAVVGDSGVGKTSLVYRLAKIDSNGSPPWTVGCSVEVFLHKYVDHRLGIEKDVFIELLDLGGSPSHKKSRAIFYNSLQGVILVHDLSNKKSYLNLKKWLQEVTTSGRQELTGVTVKTNRESEFGGDSFGSGNVPVLIVGTKRDQVADTRTAPCPKLIGLPDDAMVDTVNVNCSLDRSRPGEVNNYQAFDSFFDKIIKRKFFSRDSPDIGFQFGDQGDLSRYHLERKKKQR